MGIKDSLSTEASNKMVYQYIYIMTLMDIFTHTTILIQKAEAELRGISPKRL